MVTGDVEIPGGRIIFSPEVLLVRNTDARDVKLVVCCAIEGTDLANGGWFDGVANPVQRVQGDGGSDEGGGSNESIQGGDDYAGPDSGGEILRGRVRGARSTGSGRSGSVTRGYKQASNKRVKTITRTKSSRLVNRARGFFSCVVTNGRRLT